MPTEKFPKKSFVFHDLLYLAALFIFSLFICRSMFHEDLIVTIDGGNHLLNLFSMAQYIGRGQWFVRWVPHLSGYGYPVFNFYQPFITWIGTIFVKAGLGYVLSLNLTCVLFFFLSAVTMYIFAKELFGPSGGFISAVAYIFAPYRMVDLYLRGDYPESASFTFLPLILWAFLKLSKEPKPFYLSMACLSVSGLFLTHNCVTLLFCPVILFYIFVVHFSSARRGIQPLLISLIIFGLGIGLATFFWLPALIEKKFVHIELLMNGSLNFHNNFLSLKQLIYDPWPQKPGTPLPYEIGIMHCLLTMVTLCFIQKSTQDRPLLTQLWFFFVVLAASVFLTLSPSLLIWKHISILKFIQFPSRFLVIITLMVSILAGGFVFLWPKHRMLIVVLGAAVVILTNFFHCYPPYGSQKLNINHLDPLIVFNHLHSQDGGVFLPIWVKQTRLPIPAVPLEILKGDGQILSHHENSELHQTFTVEASSPSLLCFNSFYFPGWVVRVDGEIVDILKDNPFGLIIFPLDSGLHEINVDFGTTPIRLLATWISLISLIVLVIGLGFLKFLSYNKHS